MFSTLFCACNQVKIINQKQERAEYDNKHLYCFFFFQFMAQAFKNYIKKQNTTE